MSEITIIEDGVACSAGRTTDGWFAGVLVHPDRDLDYREPMPGVWNDRPDTLREGETLDSWSAGLADPARQQIVLLTSDGQEVRREVLAEGSGLGSPAACRRGTTEPLLIWIERTDGGSQVQLFTDGKTRTAFESPHRCRKPHLVCHDGDIVAACQIMAPGGPVVRAFDAAGQTLMEKPGRRPRLALFDGEICLLVERPHRNGCRLVLLQLDPDGAIREIELPAGDDLNMAASLVRDPQTGTLSVVHEAAPMWGFDEQLGRHRDPYLWQLQPGTREFVPGPDTANGRLPVPHRSFREARDKNATPLQPRLLMAAGRLQVAMRRFREHGVKSYGWDVYVMKHEGDGWTEPDRISENYGPPDTAYDLLPDESGGTLFQPCCEQLPCVRHEEDGDKLYSWHPGRPYDTRVEVRRWAKDDPLPEVTVLPGMAGRFGVSPGVNDLAIDPPALDAPSAPKRLVWGDLHVHSAYSKCIAPMDGTPEENLRFQRDHLGCRVLSFAEHLHLMNDAELTRVLDLLEAEAGEDCVPVFGGEPLITGQDTVFFAIEREAFERFRPILQVGRTRAGHYRRIKDMMPPHSIAVVRHFDGPGGEEAAFGPDSFDPDLEPLMEAMQVRGNSLMRELICGDGSKSEDTASGFLNAGHRVGLVGGTDHCGGYGPNHVCLTGFWVDELTPEAVWEAMWNRRTLAAANGKLAIWARCEDAGPGEAVRTEAPVRIHAWLSAATRLRRVCLLRDGKPLDWQDLDSPTAELELVDEAPESGSHWYSVTAEADSPFHHQPILCHASPIFVEVRCNERPAQLLRHRNRAKGPF